MKKLVLLLVTMLTLMAASTAFALPDWQDMPYWIGVDKQAQRVTIYSTADNHVVYKWKCSTGLNPEKTPEGVFILPNKFHSYERTPRYMYALNGQYFCWGTRIVGTILFHSYIFDGQTPDVLNMDSVENLGTAASHGCIRLGYDEARWLAQNCLPGTKTVIYVGSSDPLIRAMLDDDAVLDHPEVDIPNVPTDITLSHSGNVVMKLDEKLQLTLTVQPQDAVTDLTWSSSRPGVASVRNGLVTARKGGYTTVSVATSNGMIRRVTIEVDDPKTPRKLDLDPIGPVILDVGDKLQIAATIIPETAPQKLTWESSRTAAASVNSSGVVTAKAKGAATITAKTVNGLTQKLSVKVIDTKTPEKVTLDQSGTVILNLGDTLQLNAAVLPETAVTDLRWTTSYAKYATVDGSGLVTPVKPGSTKITVKTNNGKTAAVTVKVVDPTIPTGASLDRRGTVILNLGDTLQLHATVLPETAVTDLRWTTSYAKYATVDSGGLVTPVKPGSTKITVKTNNGKTAAVTVKVVDPTIPTGASLDQSGTVILFLGDTLQLNASVQPDTAVTDLRWKSSYTKYATVDSNGLVTPVKPGSTKITVKTNNGKSASVTVKVADPKVPMSVVLDRTGTVTMEVGESLQLNATLLPETAESTLKWSSSMRARAKVDETGLVRALYPGNATITVKTANGKTAKVNLRVVKRSANSVEVPLMPDDELLLDEAEPEEPVIKELIEDMIDEPVEEEAIAEEPATDETAGDETEAATVETEEHEDEETIKETVEEEAPVEEAAPEAADDEADQPVEEPEAAAQTVCILLPETIREEEPVLLVGQKLKLSAEITGDGSRELTWESSHEDAAVVDEYGLVTAITPGTVRITVRTAQGAAAAITIHIAEPATATDLQ